MWGVSEAFSKSNMGLIFPLSQPLVNDSQFSVSPVNYSDSDMKVLT